ncbi:MAG: hypothetical protein M3Y32_00885 [Pseudomonadota bacterium]|nr:hypothetical protein [Pseudomonadota bacterium]
MNHEELRENWQANVAPSQPLSKDQMEQRIARWGDIPASPKAFVDTAVPGHARTLYSVIGGGVGTDPAWAPKISAAENFHVNYIVAPKGCGAAMHWHDSEEVFIVQAGRWEIDWIDGASHEDGDGRRGDVHSVTLGPRDTISVPPFVHRAFRSLDGDDPVSGGLLISILGGKTPGRVMWDRSLAEKAQALGAGFDPAGNAVQIDAKAS